MTDTTETTSVTWEEPKNVRRPRRDWSGVAADLKANKDQWGRVDTDSSTPGLTYHINRGQLKDFRPKGAFEARSTKNETGTYEIFARYVGEPEVETASE